MTPEAWFEKGVAYHKRGELALAEICYGHISPSTPLYAEALGNRGGLAQQAKRYQEAVALLQQALDLQPDRVELLNNLGTALNSLGKGDEAEPLLRRALFLKPDHATAHHNLGMVLQGQGRLEEGETCYRQALALQPGHVKSLVNLGSILRTRGQLSEASEFYKQAIRHRPDYVRAHLNLGAIRIIQQQWTEATACFRKALEIDPEQAGALFDLIYTLTKQNFHTEAFHLCQTAVAKYPDQALAHANLGLVLLKQGYPTESLAAHRQAISLDSSQNGLSRNFLYTLSLDPDSSLDEKFAAHLWIAQTYAPRPDQVLPPPDPDPDPERPLRIGWITSCFYSHVMAFCLLPLMSAMRIDGGWRHYLYNHYTGADATTERFKKIAENYCCIVDMDDRQVAEKIRADGVDILVCLAGRFDQNRPFVAAYRPAPIQVSMHDVATSGIPAMDALITDSWLVPRHSREQFTERLIRLPVFYHHQTLNKASLPNPLPMVQNGFPTFACFNNPAKVNYRVLDLWARLLVRIPTARLILKYQNTYNDPMLQQRIATAMGKHYVDMERILMVGKDETYNDHLSAYHLVDLTLDTFPFSGSTTTFDSLWMGVPVITLAQEEMVSRWSGSMLHALGMDNWIAYSEEQYIDIAVLAVSQVAELAVLRQGLRNRVSSSPLVENRLRARHLGRALRALWRRWCKTN